MFERFIYLSILYCLCLVNERSIDMLEDQVLEDRYPDLMEEEDIRTDDSREKHWWEVAEKNDGNRSKFHAMRWEVYIKCNEKLINKELSV